MRCRLFASVTAGALLLAGVLAAGAERPAAAREALQLRAGQKEFLALEPILVTVRLDDPSPGGLPPAPGKGTLQFEVKPAVKPRPGGKPLPLEALAAKSGARVRTYDLLEWFQFPADGGPYTVRAVCEHKGGTLTSAPVTFTIRRPAKGDPEAGPVDRIHHTPWSNYDTNAFCGDTFDVVKRWPKSKLAPYCHYWNGRFSQNKKEYDKALASYRTVVEQYPDFALADHAAYGLAECLLAQNQKEAARKELAALRDRLDARGGKAEDRAGGQTAVRHLVAEALR
jgi:hypothetical protein